MKHIVAGIVLSLAAEGALAEGAPMQPSPTWDSLRYDVIQQETDPPAADGILTMDVPARAANPAIVPVRLTQPKGAPAIRRLVLVVDENPSPVVATFEFADTMAPLDFEMRIRVNAYSDVRAIATLADGRQVMTGHFVKASGGCAAPSGSGKDAMANAGQMKLKQTPGDDGRVVSSLMIRHPNFSGLQRDQVTLLPIPALFIDNIEVRAGDAPLFSMTGGISISEDPVFRFAHAATDAPLSVTASDVEGGSYKEQFDAAQHGQD